MNSFLDMFFGEGSQPIRRDLNARITVDENGQPLIQPLCGEATVISPEGSIDRVALTQEAFYRCGHSTRLPLGGHCAELGCRQVSCSTCFGVCEHCRKPLCPEHSYRLETKKQRFNRLGYRCHGEIGRKFFAMAVVRGILRPLHDDIKRGVA